MTNLPAFNLVIPTDFEYVDRNLATASWYDVYTIKAGEIPVIFTDIRGNVVEREEDVYYATWKAPAVLTEEYRVSRLFTASSASTTHPNTETVVRGRMYSYEVIGRTDKEIIAYITGGNAENNWERTINATIVPA